MSFAQPAWLILLILIPFIGVGVILSSRLCKKQWSSLIAPRLRSALLKHSSPIPRWIALTFLLVSIIALSFALARPQGQSESRIEKTIGRNLLIALDLSRSMRVKDVKPDRLSHAKMVIYELLEAMPNERIGLIGFAGTSYLYAPLTVDHRAVRETVEQIDESWSTVGGSNLLSAVELAIETLKKSGQARNALVILSDGEEHDNRLDEMITKARNSGVYIITIGVGTENGDFVPHPELANSNMLDADGKPIISRLQADAMRRLATETKGRYTSTTNGTNIPSLIKTAIADLDAYEMEGNERVIHIELYQWILLPAIIALIASIVASTRWRGVSSSLIIASILLTPYSLRADHATHAKEALFQQDFPKALHLYQQLAESSYLADKQARFHLGEAIAAYRSNHLQRAITAYSKALHSKDRTLLETVHLGLGNSLFRLGWTKLTDTAYPTSPDSPPSIEAFETLVKAQLQKLQNSESDESQGYLRIKNTITNWTDAIRHFKSAIEMNRSNTAAQHNCDLTYVYLKRLEKLLENSKKQSEKSLEQQGNKPQNDPESRNSPNADPSKNNDPNAPEGQGDTKNDPNQKSGDSEPNPDAQKPKAEDDNESSDEGDSKPDESPEERARRILKENADLEKGPLTPGRIEFHKPEKDW